LVPEPEPILPEDVEKLNARIKELELENADLRIKLSRVSIENGNLKDGQQKKDKELKISNKRARESEARREKFRQALYNTKSVFKTKEEELDKVVLRIQKLYS
jgi:chromosome segregation ATPase